jgi:hypothetical protein
MARESKRKRLSTRGQASLKRPVVSPPEQFVIIQRSEHDPLIMHKTLDQRISLSLLNGPEKLPKPQNLREVVCDGLIRCAAKENTMAIGMIFRYQVELGMAENRVEDLSMDAIRLRLSQLKQELTETPQERRLDEIQAEHAQREAEAAGKTYDPGKLLTQ